MKKPIMHVQGPGSSVVSREHQKSIKEDVVCDKEGSWRLNSVECDRLAKGRARLVQDGYR